jgi:hypothetical protein|tara:strand:- start:354 stop:527 length:174 start_codon:yes stop_codon:yes gene_type:complete
MDMIKNWVLSRWSERTTWDGGVIIGVSLSYILLGGLVDWLAYVALAYGVYTLVKAEL